MKTRTMWGIIIAIAALTFVAGGVGAMSPRLAPEDAVAAKINYQGRLTTPGGAPLDGVFDMRFQVYDTPSGGAILWDSGILSVTVDQGLFNVELAVDPTDFDGQGLWLRIYVDGEWLSPRQELTPVPYALSLRPGAEISGAPTAWDGWVLKTNIDGSYPLARAILGSTATGTAVRGESSGGYGLQGYSDTNWGVWGYSGAGSGGYFGSADGYGIQVYTSGSDHWDHSGYFSATWGYGIHAESAENYGIVGEGKMAGVRGNGQTQGVSGSSSNGDGVSGWSNTSTGVYGSSIENYGVEGTTWRADSNYGLFTYDNLYSLNYHSLGAEMQVVQNGGSVPVEPGDVVIFSGITTSSETGDMPVVQVARVSSANSPAVAGVVYSRFNIEAVVEDDGSGERRSQAGVEITSEGAVKPGEYLLLVVRGPTQVKASALGGDIQPGDLLSSAAREGHAARAAEVNIEGIKTTVPGTVFGKALEPLKAGQELIYVFVTLE
jgi:hypothetical protein